MQTAAINGLPSNARKSEKVTYIHRLVWRYAIILGTFSGVVQILGHLFQLFPDFWVSIVWYNLISLGIIQILGH